MTRKGAGLSPDLSDERKSSTGIAAIGDLSWGSHFCQFYQEQADLLDLVVPFFRAGLENNEFCLWITCEPCDSRDDRLNLLRGLPDSEQYLDAGDIEIIPCKEWYMGDDRFDAERVTKAWRTKLAEALERGYAGMRVHANEKWLPTSEWPAFAEYESGLNAALRDQRMIILCTYPLEGRSGADVFDIAQTHHFAIARRHGQWKIMEDTEAIGTLSALRSLSGDLEHCVTVRTRELAETNILLRQNIRRLQASEARFRVFVDHASDGIFLHDEVGTVIDANRVACASLGVPREALIGMTLADLQLGMADSAVQNELRRVDAGGVVTFQTEYRRKDGAAIPIEVRIRAFEDGGKRFALSMVRDISERLHLEDQLRQAQKMDAVGRLAGGVAHDFNNLLTVINSYADLIAETLSPDDENREFLGQIRSAGERAAKLTRQLLSFSRKQVLNPELVDVNDLIPDLSMLLKRLIGEDVHLSFARTDNRAPVKVDAGQFEQSIINLAINARDAMPRGGDITIAVNVVNLHEAQGELIDVPPGRYVLVEVSDSGHGMNEETMAHIYEPFFTTKERGKGTGLGLSMVYGFVQQSAGQIRVSSTVGKGTTFSLYLPYVEGPGERPHTVKLSELAPRGSETILLAEDEDALRELCRHVLESHGYTVIQAKNGADARSLAERHGARIDLVLSDMIMPHMGGRELAESLRVTNPTIPVLLMSGYTEDVTQLAALPCGAFLQKPFSPIELMRRVRQVLDESVDGRQVASGLNA